MRIEKTGKARFATRQRRLVKEEPSQPERQNSTCESQQARPDKFRLQEPSDNIGWRFLSEGSAALYLQLGVNSGGYVPFTEVFQFRQTASVRLSQSPPGH